MVPVPFQYQRERSTALPPGAGEFAVFKFSVVGAADGTPFQMHIGRNILNVAGRNFGSSLVKADHRGGEFAIRQLGDVHGQTEFYAGLFDIQGPLPMPRQIVRAGVGIIFLRLDGRVNRRRSFRFGAFQGQRQRMAVRVKLPVMTRSLSSTLPSYAPIIPPNSTFNVGRW